MPCTFNCNQGRACVCERCDEPLYRAEDTPAMLAKAALAAIAWCSGVCALSYVGVLLYRGFFRGGWGDSLIAVIGSI